LAEDCYLGNGLRGGVSRKGGEIFGRFFFEKKIRENFDKSRDPPWPAVRVSELISVPEFRIATADVERARGERKKG
jgi:hypothetical protein